MIHDFNCTHDPCVCEDTPAKPLTDVGDMAYDAWVLLANGQYWDETSEEGKASWNAARDRWRDEQFHPYLTESLKLAK